MKNNTGFGVAVGLAIGAGICVAIHNLAVGMACELALGAAFGVASSKRKGTYQMDQR